MSSLWDGFVRDLKGQGLTVRKVKGWKTRSAGSFDPVGVCLHHTATQSTSGDLPAAGVVTNGVAGIPGPLCNILIGRSGTVLMVAAGRANHAGLGGPLHDIPKDQGNAHLVGIECENNGTGEPWPDEQRRAMTIVSAILLERLGQPARMCVDHKQWAPKRKIDLGGIEMDDFRKQVQEKLRSLRAA